MKEKVKLATRKRTYISRSYIYIIACIASHILFQKSDSDVFFWIFFNFFFVHTHFEIWVCKLHHRVPLNWSTKKSSSNTFWMHSRLLIDHLALMNRHYARWNYLFVHPFIDLFMRASSRDLNRDRKIIEQILENASMGIFITARVNVNRICSSCGIGRLSIIKWYHKIVHRHVRVSFLTKLIYARRYIFSSRPPPNSLVRTLNLLNCAAQLAFFSYLTIR